MNLSQLTPEVIDRMSHLELQDAVYYAWLSMLPDNVKVYSLQKRIWIDPNDKIAIQLGCKFIPTYLLPRLNTCSGFSCLFREERFVASVNPCYYDDVLLSADSTEEHAIYKVWLKAFLNGWIKDTFWHDTHYYAYPPHIEDQIGLLLGSPQRPTFMLSHFNLPAGVTLKPQTKSVTPKIQSQSVTQQAIVTVTPALSDDVTLCPCGCGVTLIGRQKSATPSCRKRLERQRKVAA